MAIDNTYERIVTAAIRLILIQGVRKTSLADIAQEAGVTRVTVYRYCGDKKGLLRGVCQRIASIFQRAADGKACDSVRDVDLRLNNLGKELSMLPQGNLLARLDEINRLHPDVHEEFRAARQDAVDRLFQQALMAATQECALRDGLNLHVLKAIFLAAVMGLIENPAIISSNVSLTEVFATVTEVFRHGILKDSAEGATNDQP
jgi:AcrR family transcriptional regulator